jgi:hypothetical protein
MAGISHIDKHGSGPAVRQLCMGERALTLLDMFQKAADLPDPQSMTVYGVINGDAHDHVTMQFPRAASSERAIAEWAVRFGGTIASCEMAGDDGWELWVKTEFPFGAMKAEAFAHIPLPDKEASPHSGKVHQPGTRQGCEACMAECFCGTAGVLCVHCTGYPPF